MTLSGSSRRSPVGASAVCAFLAFAGNVVAGALPAEPRIDTGAFLHIPTATVTSPAEIGVLELRQAKPTIAYVDGFDALGCYQDGGILTFTSTGNADMTPHLCRNWCSVRSAPIFGLKGGYRCFCGEEIEPFAQKAAETECTRACYGASSFLCGAADRLNLYAPTGMDIGTLRNDAPTVTPDGNSPSPTGSGGDDGNGNSSNNNDSTNNGSNDSETTGGGGSPTGGLGSDGNAEQPSSAPGGANLSVGAVVGIAVGAAAISGILSAVVVCFLCRRRRRSHEESYSSRLPPPQQPMTYANNAPPPPQAPLPPPSPMSHHGVHEVQSAYKPHDGSVTQSYTLTPNSTSPPPPVSAVSQPPAQQPVPQAHWGSHELHNHASGPFEMQSNGR